MAIQATTAMNYGTVEEPKIALPEAVFPDSITDEDVHTKLLQYLTSRLDSDAVNRSSRVKRCAAIDKTVSTWQKLSDEDTQRKTTQETTGKAQAISMNLPLVHTHLDDMVSFFAGIYAPTAGDFIAVPESETAEAARPLVDKMNGDAKQTKHYKNLAMFLRSILKYNFGGMALRWASVDDMPLADDSEGVNQCDAIDVYNVFWDPAIIDPADIREEAEWAAMSYSRNSKWLIQRELSGVFKGVSSVLPGAGSNGNPVTYYRHPPHQAGITGTDANTVSGESNMDWNAYGAALGSDSIMLTNAHEVVRMYCWLSPSDFGLMNGETKYENNTYMLWEFIIINGRRIVSANPFVNMSIPGTAPKSEIPMYMGLLNQDDMKMEQRSVAELLQPFQSYGSFLLNSNVAGVRGAIYGLQGYDPQMFDFGSVAPGDNVARLASKTPGRDVRSGLISINGNSTQAADTMNQLGQLMAVMREFFPSQAMPNQIAGMDRAVTSQVSAVLQGVSRRLHMMVRTLDDDVLSPMRFAQYRNIMLNGAVTAGGLTDAQVARIIGSGLAQLNKEAAENAFRQLLFAVIQNPETAAEMDVLRLMNFWGNLSNLNVDLQTFRKQQPQQADPNQPGAPPQAGPAPAAPAVG